MPGSCPVQFQNQTDLQHAGILIALPSLLGQGLLKYEQEFELILSGQHDIPFIGYAGIIKNKNIVRRREFAARGDGQDVGA